MKSKISKLTLVEYQPIKINIKTFNTIIKRLIRQLKRIYIANKFDEHKSNIRRTWQLINDVMGRDKKDATSYVFIINREEISDPKIIANPFNDFFLNIGCTGDEHGYKNYLIREHLYDEFQFNLINNQHTTSIITCPYYLSLPQL